MTLKTGAAALCILMSMGTVEKAEANFLDVDDFYYTCGNGENRAFCLGYVAGLYDGQSVAERGHSYCPPSDLDMEDLMEVLIWHVERYRGDIPLTPDEMVMMGMMQEFPC